MMRGGDGVSETEGKTSWRYWLFDTAKTFALVFAVMLIPRTVLCQPFTIPSGSMEPTLQVGDYLLVSKYPYGWSRHSAPLSPPLGKGRLRGHAPERGDIVVFKKPGDARTDIIKRLVGLPGDRLQVVGGVLRINGKPVRRQALSDTLEQGPYGETMRVNRFVETLPNGKTFVTNSYGRDTAAGNTGVYVVPANCYFMMGDNRDNSLDSRFDPGAAPAGESSCPWNSELDRYLPAETGMGFVPFDNLVGRAEMVLFSRQPGAGLRLDRTFRSLTATANRSAS